MCTTTNPFYYGQIFPYVLLYIISYSITHSLHESIFARKKEENVYWKRQIIYGYMKERKCLFNDTCNTFMAFMASDIILSADHWFQSHVCERRYQVISYGLLFPIRKKERQCIHRTTKENHLFYPRYKTFRTMWHDRRTLWPIDFWHGCVTQFHTCSTHAWLGRFLTSESWLN